jgi:hypothetical protein
MKISFHSNFKAIFILIAVILAIHIYYLTLLGDK